MISFRAVLFTIVLLGSVGFTLWRGRAPERLAAASFIAAAIATGLLPDNDGSQYGHLYRGLFSVDAALLLALLPIALRANRYWPIWVASAQVLVLAIHLVKAQDPTILPSVYAWAANKMAYPMLAMTAAGAWRLHIRRGIYGNEADWSPWPQREI